VPYIIIGKKLIEAPLPPWETTLTLQLCIPGYGGVYVTSNVYGWGQLIGSGAPPGGYLTPPPHALPGAALIWKLEGQADPITPVINVVIGSVSSTVNVWVYDEPTTSVLPKSYGVSGDVNTSSLSVEICKALHAATHTTNTASHRRNLTRR
jgi:hypothetical protein